MGVALLVPSRSRPERLAEMVAAVANTAQGAVTVYVGVDYDEHALYPASTAYSNNGAVCVKYLRLPRAQLGPKTNDLAKYALYEGGAILASLGDDHLPRTAGWDEHVVRAMDRIGSGLVYCDDGLQHELLPTAPFWHANIIRALGWFCPPPIQHMCLDNYWLRLAHDIDRCVYLPDVLIEHMHPDAGKASSDAVYLDNDALYGSDAAALDEFVATQHPAVLARVKAIL